MSHTRQHEFLILLLGLYVGMFNDVRMVDERVQGGPLSHALDESALDGKGSPHVLILDDLNLLVLAFL